MRRSVSSARSVAEALFPCTDVDNSHIPFEGLSLLARVVIIRRLIIICNMLGLYYDMFIIKRIL